MGRKAKGKLPKVVKKALKQKNNPIEQETAIAPFRSANPITQKPPELVQAPLALPPSPHAEPTPNELPAVKKEERPEVFEKLGQQALLGEHPDGGNEFWITLKPQIFGGLQLRIRMHEGKVSATMIAKTLSVKRTLKRHLPAMKTHLEQRGFQVEQVDIELASASKRKSKQAKAALTSSEEDE